MKILVCVSKVPDTTTKISFSENNTKFNTENVQYILNPYDEWYALVRGLELKEEMGGDSKVIAVNVGPKENDQVIKKALAIGADEAVRIDMEPTDTYNAAFQIAEYAKSENFDIILTGKETIDYNGSALGGMLATMLEWPFISYVAKLDMEGDGKAVMKREIEGGEEELEASLPVVVSAQKGMAEARIPTMRGIMQAKKKPLNVLEPKGGDDLTEIVRYELPPEKGDCKYVDAENPGELVELLHNEAKVI